MRQISIKEFQSNIYAYLKDLPFAITRYEKIIAVVVNPSSVSISEDIVDEGVTEMKVPKKTNRKVDKDLDKLRKEAFKR